MSAQLTISRAHKIRLVPNKSQEDYFRRACGTRRMAFNWALAAWNEQYTQHTVDPENVPKPSWMELARRFNAVKRDTWPWITEVSARVPERAIKDVGTAWRNFWNGLKTGHRLGKPQFARRGTHERFYVHNQELKLDGSRVYLGKRTGWIKMRESLRFEGKIASATVSQIGDEWYISIQIDVPHVALPHPKPGTAVGIDVGVAHFATTSDGRHLDLPKDRLTALQQRLLRSQRRLSRRWSGKPKKGHADQALRDEKGQLRPKSNRFIAQARRVAKLHRRIARIREYALHGATTDLASTHEMIYLEDLQVKQMTRSAEGRGRNAKAGLNRVMLNSAVREFRRQLEYKSDAQGGHVSCVDPAYTSMTCSSCGSIDPANRPTQERFCCVACGHTENADRNAAQNILNQGRGMCAPNRPRKRKTCVENRKTNKASAELADSLKRETHPISVPSSPEFQEPKPTDVDLGQHVARDLLEEALE